MTRSQMLLFIVYAILSWLLVIECYKGLAFLVVETQNIIISGGHMGPLIEGEFTPKENEK